MTGGSACGALFGRAAIDLHGGETALIGLKYRVLNHIDSDLAYAAVKKDYPDAYALPEGERDRYLAKRSVEFIREHPRQVLLQSADNALQFWRLYPRQDHAMPHSKRLLFWLALLAEAPLFALTLLGLWLKRSLWPRWWPLALTAACLTGIHTLTVAQMRYRLPLTPLMAVFAGAALAWLGRSLPGNRKA